jgi:NCS1 family nucleobase:cation symporter-1
VNRKAVLVFAISAVVAAIAALVPAFGALSPFSWFIGAVLSAVLYYAVARGDADGRQQQSAPQA